jgi:GT2 family glycosyltransferase
VNDRHPRLSVLIVTWNERDRIVRALPPLREQLGEGDEIIVADNGSTDGTLEAVERLAPEAKILRMPSNDGYMRACNAAAELATGDVFVTLDADAIVAPGFCEAIRRPAIEGRGWDAWMGLLTMDEGRLINTSAGVSHFTGISWTRQFGEPVENAPTEPYEVAFVTGACMTTTREAWERAGGLPVDYFLYFDDVDYSWRIRLAGGRIGIEPSARVDHDYEFRRRAMKWQLLERNRWATIVRTYPTELIVLLAPALAATEVAILLMALRQGWARDKVSAWYDVIRWMPRLLRERRELQATRRASALEFSSQFTADLSTPLLGRAGRSRVLRLLLRAYWAAVRAVLR